MSLQLKPRWVGDVLVVQCTGRIVAGEAAESLHEVIHKELAQSPHIVLHAGEVQYIDSSGLGTMVRLMSAARAAGGDVKICQPPAIVRKTLTMTNLHTVFQIYETEDEAILASLQGKRSESGSHAASSGPVILCVDDSPDVVAYLAKLLRKDGLRAITATNLADAQVLMKARPPRLILGNARLVAKGKMAVEIFARCCPGVTFLDLGEEFSHDDAGEAGAKLLAQVRSQIGT